MSDRSELRPAGRPVWQLNRLGRRFMWASLGVLAVAVIMIVIAAQQMFINHQDLGFLLWIMIPATIAAAAVAYLLSSPTTATAPLTVTVSGDPNRFVSPAGQVRARVESRAKGSSHQMGVDVLWFTLKQN